MSDSVVEPGAPSPLGATCDGRGINFALFSANAEKVELCLFDGAGERELRRIAMPARTDDIWHAYIRGARGGQRYGYRVYGPFAPKRGHRFNPHKLLIDPYARKLDRPFLLHACHFAYRADGPRGDLSFDDCDDAAHMPKCVAVSQAAAPEATSQRPHRTWRDTVIYELHVRGMTMLRPDLAPELRGTLAGLASPAIIAHLTGLGVTAIELLPINPIADERHLARLGLRNYWGYNPMAYFAVEPRYLAAEGEVEFRTFVDVMHEAGIEVILDVAFNHTGEGDALGPTLSFRGIDNAVYYRLAADDPASYVNFSGCGNTLNLDHPHVRRLVLDALRYWATEMGVDGFRFDLAVALGRKGEGFRPDAPLLSALAADPDLCKLKLIAEPWDCGPEGYQLGNFGAPWAEWNDRYRDAVRRYWRGDPGQGGAFATRLSGSSDVFGTRGPLASINYVTAHDGFTLQDLVSYAVKHNEANSEGNADGASESFSWNCGIEGPNGDAAVSAKRFRDKRNLLTTLVFSLGVPMLRAGDELGLTQHGNNNAYCQDNETTWLDWRPLDEEKEQFFRFVQRALALRQACPAFRRDTFFTGNAASGKDIRWLRPDGEEMTPRDWVHSDLFAFGYLLSDATFDANNYLLLFNRSHEPTSFRLPGEGGRWQPLLDTAAPDGLCAARASALSAWPLAGRSLVLLMRRS